MSLPHYIYSPLEDQQIRILELSPARHDENVTCSLRIIRIGSDVKYEAVSYSWGTDPPDRTIFIDGCSFQVTANLEEALKVFRKDLTSPDNVGEGERDHICQEAEISEQVEKLAIDSSGAGMRLLWIDALCINQGDIKERNQQIQRMRFIYSQSTRLVVWLGEQSEDSDLAIDTAIEITSYIQQGNQEPESDIWSKQQSLPSLITKSCALAKLFFRPWFSRAWIVQEYVVSSKTDALFYCGSKTMTRAEMNGLFNAVDDILSSLYEQEQAALDCVSAYGSYTHMLSPWPTYEGNMKDRTWRSPQHQATHLFLCLVADLITGFQRWNSLQECAQLYDDEGGRQLHLWLSKCRMREATNPRDKLYAIVGLLEDLNERTSSKDFAYEELVIDYSANVQDVYSSIVRSMVLATKQLFILGACLRRSGLVTRSWTPDWTQEFDGFISRKIRFKDGRISTDYNAAGHEDAHAIFADDLSTLTVRGFILDDVIFTTGRVVNFSRQGSALVCEARMRSLYEFIKANCNPEALQSLNWKVWNNLCVASSFVFEDDKQEHKVREWFFEMFKRWDEVRLSDIGIDEDAEHDAFCDNVTCGKGINGLRHKCLLCKDYDLCSDCKPLSPEFHPVNHHFFAIHSPLIGTHPPRDPIILKFVDEMDEWADIFLTKEGWVGHTRSEVERGDHVCIIKGSDVPMMLMGLDKGGYEFISEAFVDGVMHGEALQDRRGDWNDFVLH